MKVTLEHEIPMNRYLVQQTGAELAPIAYLLNLPGPDLANRLM